MQQTDNNPISLEALRAIGIDPVAAVLASTRTLLRQPQQKQEAIRFQLLQDSFRYHYENNRVYREIAEERGVHPDQIRQMEDLLRIPSIPIKSFKDVNSHKLLTLPLQALEHELRSTGTSGIPSISRRDSMTVDRTVVGIYAILRDMFGLFGGAGLFLSPSAEDMPEMGLVKLISMFSGLLDTTSYFIHHSTFNPQEAIDQLNKWENHHTRHIIGPPFVIDRLVKYMAENDIKLQLDRNTKVITLGGWKRHTGQEIDAVGFRAACAAAFGITEGQVRDMYGLVETNFMAVECEHHRKHIPPAVHFSVRSLEEPGREVANGELGLLHVMDPSCRSYPGFIQTEDIVYLSDGECECGRHGQVVHYMYRARGAEIGCCAINLEKHMEDKEQSWSSCSIQNR
ncbi:LuxE/PaaK family acyltransferase [Paenibacillus xylaniclasticus]|uniref:LuxE/PaaK family acyltransferase n=1 Tax=Paenibacillus xylaniclasticus TaxID=588083 RepID=UPI0013DFCB76|nr:MULTISPECIES: LuxE family acyl-protein synthetase [Paenibacillus]GFN33274.1 acyl-protein synthetase [Paenibacillus curdlanolyticus]